MAFWPDHGDVGDVGFIVDCTVLYDKANLEVELFAVCLGMDIHPGGNKGEGTFHQQFSQLLSPMLLQYSDAFKLGSLFSPSDPQGSRSLLVKQEKKVCTRSVLAIEVDLFIDSLAFDEYTSAHSLALDNIALALLLCRFALLDIDELYFHVEHTTAKRRSGARLSTSKFGGRFKSMYNLINAGKPASEQVWLPMAVWT